MPIHPDLTPEELDKNKHAVLKKLKEVAKKLEDLLAGQEVNLPSMPLLGQQDPTWDKITRTRFYMKMLDAVVKGILKGNYGYCCVCHNPIAKVELSEMPWADTCGKCASQGKA
jgi:RNA polymerase-binding transcription factor DksA